MKNKKNFLIKLTIIILLFVALGTHQAFAVKRAIFPDTKLLQPMPNSSTVHPNISGNIDSTTPAELNIESAQNAPSTDQNNSTTTQTNNTKKGTNWILYFTILIIILIIIIIVYKKLKKNN